jgi:hypothetical protein
MEFKSILYLEGGPGPTGAGTPVPAFARDINFDQIVEAITASRQEYDLKGFFYAPLQELDGILYRQEVMRDLELDDLNAAVRAFCTQMTTVRQHLLQAGKIDYPLQKERWYLEAATVYCDAVQDLSRSLESSRPKSRGFRAFQQFLTHYAESAGFTSLSQEAGRIRQALSELTYTVSIQGATFRVRKYDQEEDYGQAVARFFEKFKQGAVKDWRSQFREWPGMNHVEEKILFFVSQLFPEPFSALAAFHVNHVEFLFEPITAFDREVQFYLAYLEFTAPLDQAGLKFCYPNLTRTTKAVHAVDFFDLALAHKLVRAKAPVVVNDFRLEGQERIIVITGPNQGGKTTFARAFAQVHVLGCLGCPVPGREAQLFLYDRLYTHFEQEEAAANLHGKLQDELMRMHAILSQANSNSLIVINEIFASTTWQDATAMATKVIGRVLELDALGVCVTFLDELAGMSAKTVSMVSTVAPEHDHARTFMIVRQPANGLAYALSLAASYRLTYDQLLERL